MDAQRGTLFAPGGMRLFQEDRMRAIFTPMAWRLPHWLIAIGFAISFSLYSGLLRPHEIAMWFANRPEDSQAFSEPNFGIADELSLVFSVHIPAPCAIFAALFLR